MACITITTKAEITPPPTPPPTPPLPTPPEKAIPWGGVLLALGGLAFAYLALRR